ncbi:hypothetical protein [Nocardia farcinica]|uniref:hypothetical protein n=1 Tax=Nocardia farcinica TaxID=37329 RepID=UPI0024551AEC|nr:hypothetical protein [Nocardia farcinica]
MSLGETFLDVFFELIRHARQHHPGENRIVDLALRHQPGEGIFGIADRAVSSTVKRASSAA